MLLQAPGTTIRALVESTKDEAEPVYVNVRVMTWKDKTWLDTVADQGLEDFQVARRVIGKLIVSIEGIERSDGTAWKMEREDDGILTADSAAWLIPFFAELVHMIRRGAALTEAEAKNSK